MKRMNNYMVAVYKHTDVFEHNKLQAEIFTEYPIDNLIEPCCIVGTFKKNEIKIENGIICFRDTYQGFTFDIKILKILDEIFKLWDKRKKHMAGWNSRGSPTTGMKGWDYSKPGSNDWTFINKKDHPNWEIKKVDKKEEIDGFQKINEQYVYNELYSETFEIFDGIKIVFEKNNIGFKKGEHGLILFEYNLDVFYELLGMWKDRRDIYEL